MVARRTEATSPSPAGALPFLEVTVDRDLALLIVGIVIAILGAVAIGATFCP